MSRRPPRQPLVVRARTGGRRWCNYRGFPADVAPRTGTRSTRLGEAVATSDLFRTRAGLEDGRRPMTASATRETLRYRVLRRYDLHRNYPHSCDRTALIRHCGPDARRCQAADRVLAEDHHAHGPLQSLAFQSLYGAILERGTKGDHTTVVTSIRISRP